MSLRVPTTVFVPRAVQQSDRALGLYARLRRELFKQLVLLKQLPGGPWSIHYKRDAAEGDPSLPPQFSQQIITNGTVGDNFKITSGHLEQPETYAAFKDFSLRDSSGKRPSPRTEPWLAEQQLEHLLSNLLRSVKLLVGTLHDLERRGVAQEFRTDTSPLTRLRIHLPPFPYWPRIKGMSDGDFERVLAEEKPLLDEARLTLHRLSLEPPSAPARDSDDSPNVWPLDLALQVERDLTESPHAYREAIEWWNKNFSEQVFRARAAEEVEAERDAKEVVAQPCEGEHESCPKPWRYCFLRRVVEAKQSFKRFKDPAWWRQLGRRDARRILLITLMTTRPDFDAAALGLRDVNVWSDHGTLDGPDTFGREWGDGADSEWGDPKLGDNAKWLALAAAAWQVLHNDGFGREVRETMLAQTQQHVPEPRSLPDTNARAFAFNPKQIAQKTEAGREPPESGGRARCGAGPVEPYIENAVQRAILEKLKGKALRSRPLAKALGIEQPKLFKPGGIKELIQHGKVEKHSRIGYYRPDAPPPEHAKALESNRHQKRIN